MLYLVIFLFVLIILLLFFILRFKSKETFVLDNSSNKPKIDTYNLNAVGPLQVAGDDTIEGLDNSYTYGSTFIRNLDNPSVN